MLNIILIISAALVVLVFIIVAMQPAEFRVERRASIAAPPAVVFVQVNDLHKWPAWSPWAKMDPTAINAFEGPPAGMGASMSWVGKKQVGTGRMTITESRPGNLVRFKLEFRKPFEATNTAEFTFRPEGNQTVVTWSMSGKNNFMFKAFGLIMNCDKMIGGSFEKGLADLKSIAEAEARK